MPGKKTHANRRKDEINQAKSRHAERRKDANQNTTKIKVSNGVFLHGVFLYFRALSSSFRVTCFIFSHGVIRLSAGRFFFFLLLFFRLFL